MLQVVERIRAYRAALTTRHDETHRPIERRHLLLHHRAGQLLGNTQPHDWHQATVVLFDVIVHRHRAIANLDRPRQRPRRGHLLVAHEVSPIEQHRQVPDHLPVGRRAHLRFIPRRELRLPEARCDTAKATPHFTDLLDDRLIAPHARMPQLIACPRLGEQMPRRLRMLCRKFVQPFALSRELEAEVREPTTQQYGRMLAVGIEGQLGQMTLRVLLDQFDRELRAFDTRPRYPEAIGEVAQRSRHRAPAAADTRLRHPRFLAVRRLLLDHQIERHEARQQITEALVQIVSDQRKRGRQRHTDRSVDTRHRECGIFERLHQHAALFGPVHNPLGVEHVTRQPVHLTDVTGRTKTVGVHVVGREVIAAAHHQPFQVAPIARHPMQRVDAAHDRQHGQQFVIAVHDEFTPRPLHRQRFHRLAVRG